MAERPCKRLCGKYIYCTEECEKCEYNEKTNPYAKERREKQEREREIWAGQQGAL